MRFEKFMNLSLWFFRGLALVIFGLFIYFLISNDFYLFNKFVFINTILILFMLWYYFILLFLQDKFAKGFNVDSVVEGYSVVVPSFNEDVSILEKTLVSIIDQVDSFKREIILVDDGSLISLDSFVKEFNKKYKGVDINYVRFDINKGKREAHAIAFKLAKYDVIISIDSDTILDKFALGRLVLPLQDSSIGATTGNVHILNENKNWLTKLQEGYYWVGLSIYKKAQNFNNSVRCCSGCLSAYRKSLLLDVFDDYIFQNWNGSKCTASEDRHLTNLVMEKGFKIFYVEDSVCYTEAPTKLYKFVKQQLRWKRGFYRETLYTLGYSWNVNKWLFFDSLIFSLCIPIINLFIFSANIYFAIVDPRYLIILIPSWLAFLIGSNIYFLLNEPKRFKNYLPYIFVYTFILYPLNIYALFFTKKEKWMTR